jgi:hypothetical protein
MSQRQNIAVNSFKSLRELEGLRRDKVRREGLPTCNSRREEREQRCYFMGRDVRSADDAAEVVEPLSCRSMVVIADEGGVREGV